jgi:DNA helicase II / ATP-dependent DNA helicase PcrA
LPNNVVLIAAAGSRKTTYLVETALALEDRRVLMTTYTLYNTAQIKRMLTEKAGCIPPAVSVLSWYTFLLQEGVRPYQRAITGGFRVRSIDFIGRPSRYATKARRGPYYFNSRGDLYRDRVAACVLAADEATGGAVLKRLVAVYDHVMVDEMQDLNGYDIELVDRLLDMDIAVTCAGDPRQGTFTTNRGSKNKQFKGDGIMNWLKRPERRAKLEIKTWNDCHRCTQSICDFADALYPDLPHTISMNHISPEHNGVFKITRAEVAAYVTKVAPTVLRYDKTSDTEGLPAINFGAAKGQTFDHVLIFPTKRFQGYLKSGDLSAAGSLPKHYVAITRARFSVAVVTN